jgi:hypothetical protein
MLANPHPLQLVAVCFNPGRFINRRKTQSLRNAIFERIDIAVLKFEDPIAVQANKVTVPGMINVVRIVEHLFLSQIQFLKQTTLHE